MYTMKRVKELASREMAKTVLKRWSKKLKTLNITDCNFQYTTNKSNFMIFFHLCAGKVKR